VIDDATVSVSRTFNPGPDTENWAFTWETDLQGDPALDRVEIGTVTGPCYEIVADILTSPPDFTEVVQVGDRFRHTLRWDSLPCVPHCSIPYRLESGVACYKSQSEWHTAKVTYCLKHM
jgi:hypothetical protein